MVVYFVLIARFGCNAEFGLGKITDDGACYNYIYGYNIFIDVLSIAFPFLASFFIAKTAGYLWYWACLMSLGGFLISVSVFTAVSYMIFN